MKITKIKINSLYGVKNLELDGNPVELCGSKGTGKTSVIDAIRLALTNKSERDYIVKQGENEGEILIETDSGIVIDRKKRTEGSDYKKITEFGKVVQSPEGFISEIFTPLQLNPVEFASWDRQKQNRAILDLIEFNWDVNWIKEQFGEIPRGINYDQHILQVLEDIQAKNGSYYPAREEINRSELYKRQAAEEIAAKIPQRYDLNKWKNYSLADKINELQTSQKRNSEIDRAKTFVEAYKNKVRGYKADMEIETSSDKQAISSERESLKSTMERLKAEMISAKEKITTLDEKLEDKNKVSVAEYNEKIAKLDGDIKIAEEYEAKEKISTEELQSEISEAEKMKSYISEFESMKNMNAECEQLKEKSELLTKKINLARELPSIVLETATIPLEGLTVKDGIPLINGLPISNLSGGERIELCVDVTLSKPKNLQMILLDGAEALDDISRKKLYEKCKEKGLQIIAARTTNDSEFTIIEL